MTQSKSMPQQSSNHELKEKYPYIRVGTLISICDYINIALSFLDVES